MLATTAVSFHSSPPPTSRSYLLSTSRAALVDSTNIYPRLDVHSPSPKSSVYPTSSVRTGCGWGHSESSPGSTSTPFHPRHHHLFPSSSPFLVTSKAPPTVSISLSAACSQSILGEQFCGSGLQGLEPDLPDVKSVVPFPTTRLDGDMDVEMLDGTCVARPDRHLPSVDQVPRKRRSAYSSISSSQGSLGKDGKQKRPRKSKRQVAELWWLGVVHRSILRGIEARQSAGELSAPRDFDAMDHVLAERIQRRLAGNGYTEGQLPSPLPRISSPRISVPSLNLLAPSGKTLDSGSLMLSSELNPMEHGSLDRTVIISPASKAPACASLSIVSCSPVSSTTPTSRRRHVRFEVAQRPRQSQSRPSIPRRSLSPPARPGTPPAGAPTLTLTIPQLVASLTLAYHERGRLPSRGRTCKPVEDGNNTEPSLPSLSDGGAIQDKKIIQQPTTLRAKLSSAPEKKSPLSSVVYAEG